MRSSDWSSDVCSSDLGNSSVCRHKHVIIDPDAGTIFCDDCKAYVSAFHTVVSWVGQWEEVVEAVNIQKRRLAAIWRTARNYRPRMRAIQALERAWWRSGMLPCCPHCRRGLLPEDFVDGAELTVSRDLEELGRASGRERVGQDVSCRVFAGSLKKKKT